jgi:aminopeptidase N
MQMQVLELKEAEQSFTFENIPSEPVPSLLRGFSAPVKLRYTTTAQNTCTIPLHCACHAYSVKGSAINHLL